MRSESPDNFVSGGCLGDSWSPEQDQTLLKFYEKHRHEKHRNMKLHGFQEKFFPNRSYYAVSKRLSVVKQAEKERLSLRNLPLNGGTNSRRRRTSTPQYVYSDDESTDMSLDSQPDAELISRECTSEKTASSKESDTSNSALSDRLKRKPSVENGIPRPSPPKLSKTVTSPRFASIDSPSSNVSNAGLQPASKAIAVMDVGNSYDNHNNQNEAQLSFSSLTSTQKLEEITEIDVVYYLRQAKKCGEAQNRVEELSILLSNAYEILNRYRDQSRQHMDIRKKHDDELQEIRAALLKEQEAKRVVMKELDEARQLKPCEKCKTTKAIQLKQLDQISQLKAEVDKIKDGSSKLIHPDMWRSGGMDAASVQASKFIGQMEDMLK